MRAGEPLSQVVANDTIRCDARQQRQVAREDEGQGIGFAVEQGQLQNASRRGRRADRPAAGLFWRLAAAALGWVAPLAALAVIPAPVLAASPVQGVTAMITSGTPGTGQLVPDAFMLTA